VRGCFSASWRKSGSASRSLEKAQQFAREHAIPKAYGSYEELINDPEIEAIYNPLPITCMWIVDPRGSRGKHVLCEKPVGGPWRRRGDCWRRVTTIG